MKRKNIFKSLLAAAMALTMIFGAAPLSGFVGIHLPMLSLKAEAAITGTTEDGLFEYEVGKHETDSGYQYGVTITRYKGPDSGEVVIPKIIAGYEVKWIGYAAFLDCIGITSIVIPDSVISIGEYTFSGCTSLAEITVSPDNKNYSSVDGVLFNKDGSELMVYPKGNGRSTYTVPDGVIKMGESTFSGCKNLREITIPDSVTEIGNDAFSGCTSLSKVDLPKTLTTIKSGTFSDCTSLTEIVIPDSVIAIGWYAFSNCKNLREITIPDSVTEIGYQAFSGCKNLREITIPDSVTKIDIYAFRDCTSLSKVKLSNKLRTINGFSGCTTLQR